jgi:hypothetical protein
LEGLEQIQFQEKPLKVRYFDKWGEAIDRPDYSKTTPEGVTASTVINQYLEALGGRDKLANVKSIKVSAQGEIQGMTLEVESQKTNQQQVLTEMKVMGNVMQKQVVNKDYAYIEMQGQKMDLEGKLFEQMLADAAIFPELNLDLDTVELVGITEVDGKKAYEVKITEGMLNFYDVESHLKIQVSQTVEIMGNSQTNVVKMNDYKEVNGILFPYKTVMSMGPQEIELITQNIELNAEIDSEIFK